MRWNQTWYKDRLSTIAGGVAGRVLAMIITTIKMDAVAAVEGECDGKGKK